MTFSQLRAIRFLPSAVLLLATSGCGLGGAAATVSVPHPSPATVKLCRKLHSVLPKRVDGLVRHTTSPASDLTTAWGNPAIVMRCGVPTPTTLQPGNSKFNPTADAASINGVDWLPEWLPDHSVGCTTTQLKAYIEVTIPRKYAGSDGDMSSLTDLASAIKEAIPGTL
ncbi:DUF3515 family protein [Streptomyces sp. SL13]|uniref:DUF3515 family protein n=1 Tax=Streptantibioticus silvisoli TaxID=2705255 RepID=A0AA90H1Q6_9ACTN|nr:DUF3515 family protein [Streptantibioticus silvisoli]MDI5969398.1 DUF3515 family protein [Streptantibioticus silvisoli]